MFFPRARILFFLLALAAACRSAPEAGAYALLGYTWPDGTQIVMHLSLAHSPNSIQDGTGSWNGSATDALSIWNQYITKVQFVPGDAISPAPQDGANSASFSNTVYGQAWGANVLAVTLRISSQGTNFTETDVIFNNKLKWSSYRGPLIGSGTTGTYDFHRVALHEFGHVLGLDHPDDHGQSVVAVMNSIITDLDHLADDDIAGAQSLYGFRLTSWPYAYAQSGTPFSFQITADNQPTSYSASGLPPGLQINTSTGLISGQCPTSGTFTVTITTTGALGTASGTVQLTVTPLPLTSSDNLGQIVIGDDLTYQITAANHPTSFTATGLPPGLVLDPSTGIISGKPTATGYFTVTVRAIGANSEAGDTVIIRVVNPAITSSTIPLSLLIGSTFDYQITANNRPTSFSATGLPASLSFDATTGKISGVVTLSGRYEIQLIAHGALGDASALTAITVTPLDTPTIALAKLTLPTTGTLLSDQPRNRIYVTQSNSIAVLDASSFVVVKNIPIDNLPSSAGLSLSRDGNILWITDYSPVLRRVDLNTFEVLPNIPTDRHPYLAREGADGRLYVTDFNLPGVFQVDAQSGATLNQFFANADGVPRSCVVDISADRRFLYVADYAGNGTPTTLARCDISSPSTLTALQRVLTPDSAYCSIAVAPDDHLLLQMVDRPSGALETYFRPTADLATPLSSSLSIVASQFLFTSDSTRVCATWYGTNNVSVLDVASGKVLRDITLPDFAWVNGMIPLALDKSNSNLFVAAASPTGGYAIYVFSIAPPATTPPHSLLNVSTRLRTQTGDNVLIGGFIIGGTEAKKVMVRAVGPSLANYGIFGALADPTLELHFPDGSVVTNDNWNEHRADVIASGIPPADEHEAALVATLQPGAYTAIVKGLNNTTGVALVELYDLTPRSNSRIANISTRGKVEADDNVMIGGFIIGGDQPTKVIVRAIGPSLAALGVGGALADTTLELHDGSGNIVASNDDWQSDQEQEIIATTVAPTDPHESAIVSTLQPGNYTAIVRGKNNTTGIGLVEVYNLENN